MARKWRWWEDHLPQVLSVVQEACQVLKKHGCRVEEELKSELYCIMPTCSLAGVTGIQKQKTEPLAHCVQWEWSVPVTMSGPSLITLHMW